MPIPCVIRCLIEAQGDAAPCTLDDLSAVMDARAGVRAAAEQAVSHVVFRFPQEVLA